ncbi:MAG: alcohol dehydrogenase catalytic domain-containing protein, partial [Steroidobacteraceae bacterium]
MSKAIRIHEYGGPEVLRFEDVAPEKLGARQVRIRQTAIGVNFIDTYERTGLYPSKLPVILGREAAGIVTEAGNLVTKIRPGDRVAYASNMAGGYAAERVIDASRVVPLPASVTEQQAAAMMLKGL